MQEDDRKFAPMFDAVELPPDLFHYTTGGGLMGILQGKCLWGTHVAYLNDAEETNYGLNNVLRELETLAKRIGIPDELKDDALWPSTATNGAVRWLVFELILAFTRSLVKDRVAFLRQNAGPFVACLSEKGDQLSQWRGYSGEAGYSIRFDSTALRGSIEAKQPGTQLKFDHPSLGPMELGVRHLIKMRYSTEPEFIKGGLLSFLQKILRHMTSKAADDPGFDQKRFEEVGQRILRQRMAWILGLAVQTKNPGFKEEAEYRILTFAEPGMFHAASIGLIPRLEIEFEPDCVREIVVGPGPHPDLRESSVTYFLEQSSDYKHVKVSVSKTPFRGI